MTDTTTAARFALDENAARAWLAAGIKASGDVLAHQGSNHTLPEIAENWQAGLDQHQEIEDLIEGARMRGILTTPHPRTRVHLEIDSGGEGYRWLVCVDPDHQQGLWLATSFDDSPIVGASGFTGADAGLAVLREAVESANECLTDLDTWTARAGQEARERAASGAPAAARFTMDEDAARAWITAGIAGNGDSAAHKAGLPMLAVNYCAALDEDGTATGLLVSTAVTQGIINDTAAGLDAPASSLAFEYIADGDGDGYRWLFYPDPFREPVFASWLTSMIDLGAGDTVEGAESALAVLAEAVEAGNRLAGQAAALPAPVPPRVWVLEHSHRHGNDITAHATEEHAQAAAAGIAREHWDNITGYGDDTPLTPEGLTDAEAVAAYFPKRDDEDVYIYTADVEGVPGQPDAGAVDRIQHMLRDPEWGVGMLEDIADLVRETGRVVENLPDPDDEDSPGLATWDRH